MPPTPWRWQQDRWCPWAGVMLIGMPPPLEEFRHRWHIGAGSSLPTSKWISSASPEHSDSLQMPDAGVGSCQKEEPRPVVPQPCIRGSQLWEEQQHHPSPSLPKQTASKNKKPFGALRHFCITPLAYKMWHRLHCFSFVLIQHNECIIPLACSLGLVSLIVHLGLTVFTQAFTGSVCVCVCVCVCVTGSRSQPSNCS